MFRVRFEGGDELAANLAKLSTRLSKKILREALIDGGTPMHALMEQRAPREPGAPDLADNLAIGPVRDQDNQASVGIGPNSKFFFYDLMQERGTARHRAQPFYRPAFDEKAPAAIEIIRQELWRQLTARGFGVRTTSQPSGIDPDGFQGAGAGIYRPKPRGRTR